MIRILIADDLSTRTIDKLNEIPEFEIIEKTNPSQEIFATEINNVDAMVVSATTLPPTAVVEGADNLKIIIVTGAGPNHVDTAMAHRKNIEIHTTTLFPASPAGTSTAGNREREEADVIAILKDFFNV